MMDTNSYFYNLPARIVEYFPDNQTATIQICAERIVSDANSSSDLVIREPLEGVPVHTPSGGGWAMTMPIKAGDTCILFFSQVGYDHWLYDDRDEAGTLAKLPQEWLRRSFSEDDGYALVGLNTLPRAIKSYSANDSQWRNEDASQIIDLREDLSIVITSPTSVTINAPSVTVNAPSVVVNSDTSVVNATTQADIVTPQLNITAAASVVATTPLFSITGNLLVGGAIGGGGAPAGTGLTVSGASSIDGTLESTGDLTVPNIITDNGSVNGHSHTNPEGGNTGPF
jgi:hypothetical protein